MLEMVAKVLLTSVVVVAVAEASKRSVLLGAIIASLPLTSILAMVWLYADTGDADRIAGLAGGIFWLVLPSLILFVALPVLIHAGVGADPAMMRLGDEDALVHAHHAPGFAQDDLHQPRVAAEPGGE